MKESSFGVRLQFDDIESPLSKYPVDSKDWRTDEPPSPYSNLTEKARTSYWKLTLNGNRTLLDPPDHKCQQCQQSMDWSIGDPIRQRPNNRFTYNNRHNGECVGDGQNGSKDNPLANAENNPKARQKDQERLRPAIKMKIKLWRSIFENNHVKEKELRENLAVLMVGTQNLRKVISTEAFVKSVAANLRSRDPSFSTDESIDFILIVWTEGQCTGKARVLTPEERKWMIARIDVVVFLCTWTALPLDNFKSLQPNMFSPDRTFWEKKKIKGKLCWVCPAYSDPRQVTVRSSYWAQRFFNSEPHRDALLNRYIRNYLDENNQLEFDPLFRKADILIDQYDSTPVDKRFLLNPDIRCPIDDEKFKSTFRGMKSGNQDTRLKKKKPIVCDFKDWQEVKSLHRAFGYRVMISGLPSNKVTPSADKILLDGRYNWSDDIIIDWHQNDAKVSAKFIFESKETIDEYIQDHPDEYQGMSHRKFTVSYLRTFFTALLQTHHDRSTESIEEDVDDVDVEDDVEDDDCSVIVDDFDLFDDVTFFDY